MTKSKTKASRSISAPAETITPLTEKEVWDVLKFAEIAYSGGLWPGVFTPDLVNARMKDISLSPQAGTAEKINTALSSPKSSEAELIGYTEWQELNSMLFKRTLGYFSGLMAFDWTYVCTNVKEPSEYSSPAYKKDLFMVQDFFDRFNIKQNFKTVLKQMMRAEAFFGVFREDGERFVMQELPQQYCQITGRYEYGLLFDFNMYWFWQQGVSLEMYPSIFTKMYQRTFNNENISAYNPARTVDTRTGSFVYWVQTSPADGFTAFKFSPEIGARVPYFAALLPTSVIEPIVRGLQTNSYIQQASKILFGGVPLLKDAGTKLKDQVAISAENLGKFLALVQAAVPSAIKVAAAPLEDTTAIEFTGSDTMYDSYLKTSASSAGINSRLIYSHDRQNILETKLSMDIDINVLRPVYAQFEDWLGYYVNRRTKKYKFKFLFEGFENAISREERLGTVVKLIDYGIVSDQKIAAAVGMSPFDLRRMMEETNANKFVDKLTPILQGNQIPANGEESAGKGRPRKKESALGDSGAETRGDGGNEEKNEE